MGVGLGDPAEQFGAFGFETDVRTRATIVDEFVELLVRLWSGQRVDFSGRHFTAVNVQLTPPLQQPRIPIWVGGGVGRMAPLRRAARWDGFVPLSASWPDGTVSVDDFRLGASALSTAGARYEGFDIVVIADRAGNHPDDHELATIESVGVTWHLLQPFTIEDGNRHARRGPAM